jgi:hypothetical protein
MIVFVAASATPAECRGIVPISHGFAPQVAQNGTRTLRIVQMKPMADARVFAE